MTWLKKVGQFLVEGISRVMEWFPFLAPLTPLTQGSTKNIESDLGAIQNIIVAVESILTAPGSGAAKLTAAVPLVKTFIQNSSILVGKNVANQTLFTTACTEITQGVVDLLNSIEPPSAK